MPKHSPPCSTSPPLLTASGVVPRHIRRLVAERRIPYIKWGHLLRFDPTEIEAWIDDNRRRARQPLSR